MSRRLLLIGKEECVQDDARRLIQRATGAKRRHLARGNPSGVVTRIRAAFGGLRVTLVCGLRLARSIPARRRKVCCADLAPAKKKRHAEACLFFLAGDEGFEPPQTESESGVLPLHKSPKLPQRRNASIIIAGLAHLSSVIFQKSAKAANFSAPAFPFPGSFFRALRQNRRLRAAFQLLTRKSVLFLLAGSMRGIARAAPY